MPEPLLFPTLMHEWSSGTTGLEATASLFRIVEILASSPQTERERAGEALLVQWFPRVNALAIFGRDSDETLAVIGFQDVVADDCDWDAFIAAFCALLQLVMNGAQDASEEDLEQLNTLWQAFSPDMPQLVL